MTGLRETTYAARRVAARRVAAITVAGLVAALLPLVVGASSPAAAAVCVDETDKAGIPPFQTGCDDVTPPRVTMVGMVPEPNAMGYTNARTLRVDFTGAHTDADTGVIGFECQLYNTAEPPAAWTTCTSPSVYAGLPDTTGTPYTFRVRAVDVTDRDVQACDSEPFVDACLGDPDLPDHESPGAARTIAIDTIAPNTFLSHQPVDKIRPDWPVVLTANPVLAVNSNEPAGFTCTVNGKAVAPCGPGTVALSNLAPGDVSFVAQAVDRGGNADPTPATTRFFVPSNIKGNKGSGWTTVRETGRFGNDYVQATKVGQVLKIKRIKKVREVRLIAAVGPKAGIIEVRIGTSQWYVVDLFAKKARFAQVVVRDHYSPLRSGAIRIRVKAMGGNKSGVRLDALVARK